MRRQQQRLRSQVRQLAVFLALCAAVAILWQLTRKSGDGAKSARPATMEQSAAPSSAPTPPAAPPIEVAERLNVPPPVIDQVIVEKPRVCDGEDSLVEVRAHAPDGDDAAIHVVIDGHAGNRVPVQPRFDDHDATRPIFAVVFDGKGQSVKVPVPLEVEHCKADRRVAISGSALVNAVDTYELTARVLEPPSPGQRIRPLKTSDVRRYVWHFGDGSPDETSSAPTVVHSFESRPQTSVYSSMLVQAEAELVDGSHVKGRMTLDLLNVAYETLRDKGVVLLLGSSDQRFPQTQTDGSLAQHVRVRHILKQEVAISQVIAEYTFSDGRPVRREVVDPVDLLGSTRIAPGHGAEATLRIGTDADPKLAMVTYDLLGSAPNGRPAHGKISIMRPAPLPTLENSEHVTDAALTAKILAARKILGKEFVTSDEIARLEREGRLGPTAAN